MNFSKIIENSNFNYPKEKKRTFQEVVERFDSANYIYISSYGTTTKSYRNKNRLFSELVKQCRLKTVKIMTKIRKERFEVITGNEF